MGEVRARYRSRPRPFHPPAAGCATTGKAKLLTTRARQHRSIHKPQIEQRQRKLQAMGRTLARQLTLTANRSNAQQRKCTTTQKTATNKEQAARTNLHGALLGHERLVVVLEGRARVGGPAAAQVEPQEAHRKKRTCGMRHVRQRLQRGAQH